MTEGLDYERLMGLMQRGSNAAAALAAVGPHLDAMAKSVDARALGLANRDALTPALAQQLWFEKLALLRLKTQLEGAERTGLSAAKRLEKPLAEALAQREGEGNGG